MLPFSVGSLNLSLVLMFLSSPPPAQHFQLSQVQLPVARNRETIPLSPKKSPCLFTAIGRVQAEPPDAGLGFFLTLFLLLNDVSINNHSLQIQL